MAVHADVIGIAWAMPAFRSGRCTEWVHALAALRTQLTLLDERLLERPLFGRHLVWWLAATGVVLTGCRGLLADDPVAYDPEAAMQQVQRVVVGVKGMGDPGSCGTGTVGGWQGDPGGAASRSGWVGEWVGGPPLLPRRLPIERGAWGVCAVEPEAQWSADRLSWTNCCGWSG
jgi:hypothetical protein